MNIPEESIEKAAGAIYELDDEYTPYLVARAALSAAAPLIQAPEVVTTLRELDLMDEWDVIMDASGRVCEKITSYAFVTTGSAAWIENKDIPLPARVLYRVRDDEEEQS